MSDILQEVDEALRKEKAEKFWHDNKTAIIVSFVMIIIAAASWSAIKQYNHHINGQQTEKLLFALDSINPSEEITKIADSLNPPLKSLSLMNKAGILIGNKQFLEAGDIYKTISSDKSSPTIIRELALLMETKISVLEEDFNKEIAYSNLDKLIASTESPWKSQAMLEKAVIRVHFDNDFESAIKILDELTKEKLIPISLIQRANSLKHIYKIKLADAKEG